MDGALVLFSNSLAAADYKIYREALQNGALQHEIPFTSQRKRKTVFVKAQQFSQSIKKDLKGELLIISNGASDVVLERCTTAIGEQGQIC